MSEELDAQEDRFPPGSLVMADRGPVAGLVVWEVIEHGVGEVLPETAVERVAVHPDIYNRHPGGDWRIGTTHKLLTSVLTDVNPLLLMAFAASETFT